MCGQSCGAQPVCSSRRRRGIPEIDSELELLESDLFEDSEIFSLSGESIFHPSLGSSPCS